MNTQASPLVLIILDGWGYRAETDHNAIAAAKTPHWDRLWESYPHTLVHASGPAVGLPEGQMGNSEVGHLHIGAGRLVSQDLNRINEAIASGDFANNDTLQAAIAKAKQHNSRIHIMGLVSPGGVHSHEDHIAALIRLIGANGHPHCFLHAFLDGRDTPPRSAKTSLENLSTLMHENKLGGIASICGRYYAMDRDQRWDRSQQAYDLLTAGEAKFAAADAVAGLQMAYERGENDEFVQPTTTTGDNPITIEDNDIVIFMNFRADRARQLSWAFTEAEFAHFARKQIPNLSAFITLTTYSKVDNAAVAFAPQILNHIFVDTVAGLGLKQLRIAETEKYAHVTYFFNGGQEQPFPGEDRIMIPSPKVATYDQQPQMHAPELTEKLIEAINSKQYNCIICNFANPDMVGHSGNFEATVKAIEAIDDCLGKIATALKNCGGEMVITADHGNAEMMYNTDHNQAHTAHTLNPVPCLYVGRPAKVLKESGSLIDIAPTLLSLLGIQPPSEMTGDPLFLAE